MGGAERQVCDLADAFSALGYGVKIAYLLQPLIVRPKSEEVELIWLGGEKSSFAMAKAYSNLVRLIKLERPDVVHSHMYHANIMTRLTKLCIRIPRLICTAHNTNEGGTLRMFSYRITNFLGDVFTNVSQDAVTAFEEKKAVAVDSMLAMQNGINTELLRFNNDSRLLVRHQLLLQSKTVFIAIGRFDEQKDYPNLLAAFTQVLEVQSESHLLIVGDGELRSLLEKIIIENNLTNNVTLLGVRNDIPELLSSADVFVLSSAWEGFGLVVAEAMSCERVVVATDCGGVASVVGDEGFLVPPKDSEALAKAMKEAALLTNDKARNLGMRARRRVIRKYGIDNVVVKWFEFYKG